MFVIPTTNVGVSQRVVATLVASAVILASVGFYNTAQAANLVSVSNTLSDSDLNVTSAHTIAFTIPTGSSLVNTQDIDITFPAQFTGVGGIDGGDITVTVNAGADTATNVAVVGQVLTFDGIDATAGQEVVVAIADGIVTNPNLTDSFEFIVETEAGDSGRTRVAIIDNVLVTAIVNTTFDFVISATTTGITINGETTTIESTATTIPFGVLTAGDAEVIGQDLSVTTNARNGFVVTVESDSELESSNGAIIDGFIDGTDVANPTAWVGLTTDINDETTWGHWGMTISDSDIFTLGGFYNDDFAAEEFVAVSSTTPRQVFHHDGPSDGSTADIGTASVAYKILISALQEAADDYNTTLTYIATPTF